MLTRSQEGDVETLALQVLLAKDVGDTLWRCLAAKEVLGLARGATELWRLALELLPERLPRPLPFALLSLDEKTAALRFLPLLESALLFDNFAAWDPGSCALALEERGRLCRKAQHGCWELGPGTESLPRMGRLLSGRSSCSGGLIALHAPLSIWCVQMINENPLTDYGPSGLVFRFNDVVRPRLLAFRCKVTAHRPHRAGAVLALATGMGNDKTPEGAGVFVHFTRQPEGRDVYASKFADPVGHWRDGEWIDVRVGMNWKDRMLRVLLTHADGSTGDVREMPFNDMGCEGVRFLLLYNLTGDFESCWTDILLI
mmetsp:Transcript_34436/g.62106  ORF Transcript_34436/g.62106 Transcript_34436/m.62106 type:complete len:314 (+) Transcript_34436:71-1012(+)